ncbi:heat shock protein 90-5, chloroplastic [Selaginella moellendorffii]|uniref:heat shock protein 90-5, chloroplastic n=1 Tax=Selaginella moellendorffii TaxID=88036 RepID=UPI000D1C68C1|nr:heat shock protein 90-5, chloroplastic [Selaginella moellendorffii]|eukprot:XP_024528386.1 heat shock protein 90-5, chloroplastic [Selaginella moellendorffii]
MNSCSRKALSVTLLRTMAVSPAATSVRSLSTATAALPLRSNADKGAKSVPLQKRSQFLPLAHGSRFLSSGRAIAGNVGFTSEERRADWNRMSVRAEATVAEAPPAEPAAEKFQYQAEVSRLMDLIVNSLYSHKEVFLRELVSNASDALDKLRFLSVTEPSLLDPNPNLEIRIKADQEKGTVTIIDSGVGMTRQELVDSLGTIAQSGTAKFFSAIKENKAALGDNNLIGQFGVGFYSAFLVANRVTVSTRHSKSDKQWVWEGEANENDYSVYEETDPDKLIPRGTVVTLTLKADDKFEYTDPVRILNLVKNYSQFISFPIYTWQEKTVEKEVEDTEASEAPPADPASAAIEGGEAPAPQKKMKTITQKVYDWELINETKPIWMRSQKEIDPEEYKEFFKTTFKEFLPPLGYSHFTTEGEVEFRSLLYVPGMAPLSHEENQGLKTKNIRLYVKRVFISDSFEGDLFPRYLSFIKGIVDSNDLPLNVSREILQESRIVRIMKKRLVRKSFDLLDEIANREKKEDYKIFWTCFSKNIKLGCIEDANNHKRLAPLLRFFSSKNEEEMTNLDDYIRNMKPEQNAIYFIAADTVKSCKSAPFLEQLLARDYEVLFLVDPIDEVALTSLQSYKEKKFVDISKEDLDLGAADEAKEQEIEREFTYCCDWIKQILGEKVASVGISNRLSTSPCVLVTGKHGWSANMERIMKAQALGDTSQLDYMRGKRILEINPQHPIIASLNEACKSSPHDTRAQEIVELLYETAHVSSGFTPDNASEFGARIYDMIGVALGGRQVLSGQEEEYNAPSAPQVDYSQGYSGGYGVSPPPPEASAAPPPPPPATEAEVVVEPSEVREGDPWKS